ncbi:MAG TPA: cupin domain-containing protein [Chloroflexota bacterium]
MEQTDQRVPYWEWQQQEGLPIVTGLVVGDLNEIKVTPWDRVGGAGAFTDLGVERGREGGGWVCEIPAGGNLNPLRHMFDEAIYVTQGRGATTFWVEGSGKQMVEWQEGSLVAIPLNVWHQHFNTGPTPARFYSLNNAGTIMNFYDNEEFVWDNPFVFRDRYSGQDEFFSGDGDLLALAAATYRRVWRTNFVPNARTLDLYEWKQRGAGGANVILQMAETVCPHISQFPIGTYKKAHKHGDRSGPGGVQLLILKGTGFTLAWPAGATEFNKLDWKQNGLVVAPNEYYHQHFNSGAIPARYLACIGIGAHRTRDMKVLSDLSESEGGWQIEYENENPEVHRIFEAELAEHEAECHMAGQSPFCTVKG